MIKKVCLASLLACWFAAGVAIAQAPPIGQGGAAPGPPLVFRGGHITASGPQPKLSGCGTGAFLIGTDTMGQFFPGADWSGAGCTMTFGARFEVTPGVVTICAVNPSNNLTNASTNTTPTSVVISITPLVQTGFTWLCFLAPF